MTGTAFIRVERDGKFQNIPAEHMTEEELHEKFGLIEGNWMDYFCRKIRDLEAFLEGEGYSLEGEST